MPKLYIIYLPGLGDHKINGQRRAIALWRLYGVTAEVFQMHWADTTTLENKLACLLKRIDELTANGNKVGLVGVSAGASAAINAFATRQDAVAGVVLIAGKVNHPENVGSGVRSGNPSFWTSVQACGQSLNQLGPDARQRIQSRFAIKDELVPETDSRIPGVDNRRVFSFGHVVTITSQITFGAPFIVRFLKSVAKL